MNGSLILENSARKILLTTTCKFCNQHSTRETKNQLCNFSIVRCQKDIELVSDAIDSE